MLAGGGLGLRAVFFGSAIALQFFLYDYFKTVLKVAPDDLEQVSSCIVYTTDISSHYLWHRLEAVMTA